jgi:hypothetical protein
MKHVEHRIRFHDVLSIICGAKALIVKTAGGSEILTASSKLANGYATLGFTVQYHVSNCIRDILNVSF